ncbi:hypothetical protein IQ235_15065 [Oscillatoriales cyanobacterium LEGE 11467]|uniref:Uncharacterized protein n=1 Tax=Zarconia navalis LEGE 11467 TaxID=1828826 RepID=A0A928Z909_9CYAN|nr:hypothetical protein [Zarconia navalis LEGE 11467]
MQTIERERNLRAARIALDIVETQWERVLRELDALDVDSDARMAAARLVGQFQILDKLVQAFSEGSLGSDYEIEAPWRQKLIERVVESFELDFNPSSPPRRYRGLAEQLAHACGLEVIED